MPRHRILRIAAAAPLAAALSLPPAADLAGQEEWEVDLVQGEDGSLKLEGFNGLERESVNLLKGDSTRLIVHCEEGVECSTGVTASFPGQERVDQPETSAESATIWIRTNQVGAGDTTTVEIAVGNEPASPKIRVARPTATAAAIRRRHRPREDRSR